MPVPISAFVTGWREDEAFRSTFTARLAAVPYAAFRWEMPAVTAATADRFDADAGNVLPFPNLGGDAILVVPRPIAAPTAYGHLAAFVRRAPAHQQDAFWQAVGAAMSARLGARPVWLNTAGAGVPWLHLRLDDRPKYYRHRPYAAG